MKDFARRMIGIDRRIIFLLIAAAVLLPLLQIGRASCRERV